MSTLRSATCMLEDTRLTLPRGCPARRYMVVSRALIAFYLVNTWCDHQVKSHFFSSRPLSRPLVSEVWTPLRTGSAAVAGSGAASVRQPRPSAAEANTGNRRLLHRMAGGHGWGGGGAVTRARQCQYYAEMQQCQCSRANGCSPNNASGNEKPD